MSKFFPLQSKKIQLSVVMFGSSYKGNIKQRYCSNPFDRSRSFLVGAEYESVDWQGADELYDVKIRSSVSGRYSHSIFTSYIINNTDGIILAFDPRQKQNDIKFLYNKVVDRFDENITITVFLIEKKVQFSTEAKNEMERFFRKHNIECHLMNCQGGGISPAFDSAFKATAARKKSQQVYSTCC